MSDANLTRNVLYGALALQLGYITRDQLIAATSALDAGDSRPLEVILVSQSALDKSAHSAISLLVNERLSVDEQTISSDGEGVEADGHQHTIIPPSLPGKDSTIAKHRGTSTSYEPCSAEGQRYKLVRMHAKGGLGKISIALDTELNREVAVKEILEQHADSDDSRARFVMEAEVTSGLEHPSIVPIYGMGIHADGRPFYAMRLIRGESLTRAIDEFHQSHRGEKITPLSIEFRHLLRRFVDICNAIEYAHSRGIIHRDLKPENVMLGSYGETLVVDWGLAKSIGEDFEGSATDRLVTSTVDMALTQAGVAVGSPVFMSPEQASGQLDQIDNRTDIYGLGATLYYLLTGKRPYSGDSVNSILNQVKKGGFTPLHEQLPNLPNAVVAVCEKAMALCPKERYSTARDVVDDIERFLADEPVSCHRESMRTKMRRWLRNHPKISAATVVTVALLTVGLTAFNVFLDEKNRQLTEAYDRENQALTKANEEKGKAIKLAEEKAQLASAEAIARATAVKKNTLLQIRLSERIYEAKGAAAGLVAAAHALSRAEAAQDDEGSSALRFMIGALAQEAHQQMAVLENRQPIQAMAINPKQSLIAAVPGSSKQVALWSYFANQLEQLDFDQVVTAVEFTPDGRHLAIGFGKVVRLLDLSTKQLAKHSFEHDVSIDAIAFDPHSVTMFCGGLGMGRLWNLNDFRLLHSLPVSKAAFDPEGKMIATASMEKVVRLWSVKSGKEIGAGFEHDSLVWRAVTFSPDGRRIATGDEKGLVRFWDVETGAELQDLRLRHDSMIWCVSFNPDGSRLAVGTERERNASIWDNVTSQRIGFPIQHNGEVSFVGFSPDGTMAITASGDGTIRVLKIRDKTVAAFQHPAKVRSVVFTGNDNQLATGCEDRHVRLFDLEARNSKSLSFEHSSPVTGLAVTSNGQFLASSGAKNVAIWDLSNDKHHSTIKSELSWTCMAFRSDAHLLMGNCVSPLLRLKPGSAKVYRLDSGALEATLLTDTPIVSVASSPDGQRLVTGSLDNTAHLWNADTMKLVGAPISDKAPIFAAAFSPDSKFVATGGRRVQIRRCKTGARVGSDLVHARMAIEVAFSTDSRRLSTASQANTLQVWDIATGSLVFDTIHVPGRLQDAKFSPGGTKAITIEKVPQGQQLRLWLLSSGVSVPLFQGSGAHSAVFNQDGTMVAACIGDYVRVWRIPTPPQVSSEQIKLWAEATTGLTIDSTGMNTRQMTADEWKAKSSQPLPNLYAD